MLTKVVAFTRRHPIIRGMIAYGTMWPLSSIIQQSIAGKRWETYDWNQVTRFCLYGSLFTAPTLYAWVRFSTIMWPSTSLKTAFKKAVIEQVTYGPAAMLCFFFGMGLLEFKTVEQAKEDAKVKFLPTYKVAILFWPVLQTINFAFVPERNRVPYVSVCSLVWACFLSYMDKLETEKIKEKKTKTVLISS